MKKKILVPVLLAGVLLFANCKKDSNSNSYDLTVYNETDSVTQTYLFVNEANKGKLPYIKSGVEDCGDSRALHVSLDPGSYAVVVKDAQGAVKNSLVLQVNEDATITGSNYTLVQADKCLIVAIDY